MSNPTHVVPTKKVTYIGIDYHINLFAIAVLLEGKKDFHKYIYLNNTERNSKKYPRKPFKDYQIRTCKEAFTNGYVFQRKMKSWRYHWDFIISSLISKKP
jgi:hypothetical protein